MEFSEENYKQKRRSSRSIEVEKSSRKFNLENDYDSTINNYGTSKSEKLDMLQKVFLTNASFNKKTKEYYLNRFQILQILKQCDILNSHIISKTNADIILTKLKPNNNKYEFVDFLNYLTEICKFIFKEKYNKNPKSYINNFLDYILNSYYDCFQRKLQSNYVEKKIDNNCTINSLKKIIESNIDRHALKLLLSLNYQFKNLYICYFPYENSKNKKVFEQDTLIVKSMENFIVFGKDFEIVPYMINEKNYVTYYNLILKHQKDYTETINDMFQSIELKNEKKFQDLGTCFKLSTFILFLYHFSLLLYYKNFKVKFSVNKTNRPEDLELIVFFLQRLEHSNGVSKYRLKKHRTNESKFTFIPTNQDIEIVLKDLNEDKYGGKTLLTNLNEAILTSTIFNDDDDKEINTIEKENNNNNNNLLNSLLSFDKFLSNSGRNKGSNSNTNILKKGEEICKDTKTINELINRQLIKTLNTSSNTNYLKDKKKLYNTINTEDNNNKNKDKDIPILNLENFLNVDSDVVKVISEKLDSLGEIYLKCCKMYDNRVFNRMSFSAFLQFLKIANILIGIPENMRENYRKMGEKLTQKKINVSEVKTFDVNLKGSINCQNALFTDEEKNYMQNISKIVNAKNKDFEEKIGIGEASIIFYSLTNTKNFPIYKEIIKSQFDKNIGIDLKIRDCLFKAKIFDKKSFLENQQNIPGKMDFMLFIKSFELIATKLYPDETLNNAVLLLLNKKIIPILPKENILNSDEVSKALDKLKEKDIKYFLNELSPLIKPLYQQYSDFDNYMKFPNFLDFYTHFNLFPDLISLSQMKTIFIALNELFNNNYNTNNSEIKNTQIQTEKLDFNMFLAALAITAMFFNYKNIVTDIDRLLYLCFTIYNAKPIQEKKMEGTADVETNKNLNEFLKNIKKKFSKKKTEEKDKKKNEKEKICLTDREIVKKLDIHFKFNEEQENQKEMLNTFL